MSVGNRIFLQRDLPDLKVMEAFRSLPAANVDIDEKLDGFVTEGGLYFGFDTAEL